MEAIQRAIGPNLSDEEVKKGEKPREEFRKEVAGLRANWQNPDTNIKTSFELLEIPKTYDKIKSHFDSQLAWINSNVELSERQVSAKKRKFYETYQSLQDGAGLEAIEAIQQIPEENQQKAIVYFPFTQYKEDLGKQLKNIAEQLKEKVKEENIKILERTTIDIVKEAFYDVLKWSLLIAYIIISLRAASFAANEVLWQPLPYRIISFFYTFLFGFIWGPYYLYVSIRHLIFDTPAPRFESIFPLYQYNKENPLTLLDRLFGYPNTKELCDWIAMKKGEYWKGRETASIPTTLFDDLMAERQEAINSKA